MLEKVANAPNIVKIVMTLSSIVSPLRVNESTTIGMPKYALVLFLLLFVYYAYVVYIRSGRDVFVHLIILFGAAIINIVILLTILWYRKKHADEDQNLVAEPSSIQYVKNESGTEQEDTSEAEAEGEGLETLKTKVGEEEDEEMQTL